MQGTCLECYNSRNWCSCCSLFRNWHRTTTRKASSLRKFNSACTWASRIYWGPVCSWFVKVCDIFHAWGHIPRASARVSFGQSTSAKTNKKDTVCHLPKRHVCPSPKQPFFSSFPLSTATSMHSQHSNNQDKGVHKAQNCEPAMSWNRLYHIATISSCDILWLILSFMMLCFWVCKCLHSESLPGFSKTPQAKKHS